MRKNKWTERYCGASLSGTVEIQRSSRTITFLPRNLLSQNIHSTEYVKRISDGNVSQQKYQR
jgi:hypothetical protein